MNEILFRLLAEKIECTVTGIRVGGYNVTKDVRGMYVVWDSRDLAVDAFGSVADLLFFLRNPNAAT